MPYDENGQWYQDPNKYADQGFLGTLLGGIGGLFGGGSPAPTAAEEPTPAAPQPSSNADEWSDAEREVLAQKARKDALEIAIDEERVRILRAQADEATDPEIRQSKLDQAKAAAERARADADRIRNSLPPGAQAQFEHDLAMARQKAQQDFERAQLESRQQFEGAQNQASRDFTAQQNDLSRGVTLRGQEIDRLKAQDDWVLGVLRQQVAEGTLSLQRATNMFNAYVDRARLPSQIMESVSRAVEPFSASIPGKDFVLPGWEKGGPIDSLSRAAGIDPSTTVQRNPYKDLKQVDVYKLAKKAGADFSQTKIPDPGKLFGDVPVPSTNFANYQSALAGFPAAQFSGPAAPPQAGPAMSAMPSAQFALPPEEIARLNSLLDQANVPPMAQ